APRGREILLQRRDLRRYGTRALLVRRAVELARFLRAEHAILDRRAGAGERQERDRDVRVLDRDRERGAQLVAVERAVAALAQPARPQLRPVAELPSRIRRVAGAVAFEAGAAGTIIFAAGAEAAEAEAFVGERDRPVRIALPGRNRVAHAGDQQIAH